MAHFNLAFGFLLIAILVPIAWVDFRHHIIPDKLNAALFVGGCVALWVTGQPPIIDALLGFVLAAVVFLAVRFAYKSLRGIEGLGLGDVKFFAASGVWVGATGLPWLTLFAAISGLVFALAVSLVFGNIGHKTRLAFGPHLAIGMLATWIAKSNNLM
jgi:leader peptidase (prepilin peptidase) / N-methyltransferase